MPVKNVKKVVYRKRKAAKPPMVRKKYSSEIIARDPFPKTKNCTLVYKNPSTLFSTGALVNYNSLRIMCNGCYDFDSSNYFGDKQPLYFDSLCSDTGPYTQYKVYAWKTTIKVLSSTSNPLNVYFDPNASSQFDADTPTEMKNRPGVQHRMITGQANAQPYATFTKYNTLKSIVGKNQTGDSTYSGAYNANPVNAIYASLLIETATGTVVNSDTLVSVSHVFYVQFYNRDALIS